MIIVPIQKFGIGDIIFEMTLVRSFGSELPFGYDADRKQDYIIGDYHFLPLRWADVMLNVPYTMCMKAKYMLYSLDWKAWKVRAAWYRDIERETALQTKVGIIPGKPYKLINRHFRSNNSGIAEIKEQGIEMRNVSGFSLFDWCSILEDATEIHTVSTSIIYLLELLDLKMPIHLYERLPDENHFKNVDYLFTKPYILH